MVKEDLGLEAWSAEAPGAVIDMSFVWIVVFLGLLGVGLYFIQKKLKGGQVMHDFLNCMTEPGRKHDPVVGRDEEVERIIHILSRRTKRNPLLLGDAGVGKTALIEGLAGRLVKGDMPSKLQGFTLYSLNIARLFGDTKYRGDLERRLADLVHMFENQPKVILFIDEIHTLLQVGRSEGGLSVLDILKPMMARQNSRLIGATTAGEYKQFLQGDEALERRFQPMLVREVSFAEAEQIVRGLKGVYEDYHGVMIADEAVKVAVQAREQFATRRLPDIALDLIDEAAAKVSIELEESHRGALGAIHAAGSRKERGGRVEAEDIEAVLAEWLAR